jgi:signal transduction histidine kinase
MFFGGSEGFNAFFPENIRDNPYVPPVVLTDFQLFNKPVAIGKDSPLKKAINVADQITLRYDQNVFRLRFAALSFAQPQENRYAYKLEGFDDDWRSTDAGDHSATYTRLAPGNYTFRVKASNNDGVWNEQGTSIKITVIPPWWLTWWFRSALIATVLAMVITGHRLRTRQINKRSEALERLVADRTTELQAANQELETFSYSVSHDLRAPLRSIDGFSRILLEDYANKLDDEGKDSLKRVRAASQRMGRLIDDLLQLARHSRSEMHCEPVDLSALAQTIAGELKLTAPDRPVEFAIAPGLVAHADGTLLRAVLENLLGNAWKFTGKQPSARIEFGATTRAGQPSFFVRDNGAGFDMKYASKLFGTFQRLHSPADFPGTGIGLATVQRIIHRHGGRVWAESEVGHGATFYFSLPLAT